jgi:hypothetical protein
LDKSDKLRSLALRTGRLGKSGDDDDGACGPAVGLDKKYEFVSPDLLFVSTTEASTLLPEG